MHPPRHTAFLQQMTSGLAAIYKHDHNLHLTSLFYFPSHNSLDLRLVWGEQGVRLTFEMKSMREKWRIKSFSVSAWHLRYSVLELYIAIQKFMKQITPLALKKKKSISVLFNSNFSPNITCVKEDCQAAVITEGWNPSLNYEFAWLSELKLAIK